MPQVTVFAVHNIEPSLVIDDDHTFDTPRGYSTPQIMILWFHAISMVETASAGTTLVANILGESNPFASSYLVMANESRHDGRDKGAANA